MTAEAPFEHNIAQVWTWEARGERIVQWECECGWHPKGTQPIKVQSGQSPHQALRSSHFHHVKRVMKREEAPSPK